MITLMTVPDDPTSRKSDAPLCYLVTDIETDGPEPGQNSMRTFASIAVNERGDIFDRFEGRLQELEGAAPDARTLTWLLSDPLVWSDIQLNPLPAHDVITAYVDWIRRLKSQAVFVAHPLSFDGYWLDWYLRKFAHARLCCGPYGGEQVFARAGIDLQSFIMGTMGWSYEKCNRSTYPEEWFGGYKHSHRASDDAMGYAHIFSTMLRMRQERS